jgi:N4-gp56 family major capsid protein
MANEIGVTEVDSARQQVVANIVQTVLKQESILMPTVTDYSRFAGPGAKSVDINRRTQFAAADKAENTNLTAQEITFAADNIALSKHKAIYAKIERIAGLQANVEVSAEVLMEQAKELALQIDKDLIVQLKLVSTSAPDHLLDYANTPTDTLAQADILEARRLMNVQKVPMQDRFMVISPDQEKAVLSISDFVRADAYGSAGGLINAELGRLYGFTVLMHTELSAAHSLFYHKSHVGWAMQLNPEFATNFDLPSVSDEYLLHQIYGVKVLDSGKRGVFFNGSGS